MTALTLALANSILDHAFKCGAEEGMKPLTAVVLDPGGHLVALQRQDGCSILRPQIAQGKAFGAIAVGAGSRWLNAQAVDRPHFLEGLSNVSGGRIVPVPGGVLIREKTGTLIGAVGITGDTSDNDERAAIGGIEAVGLVADGG